MGDEELRGLERELAAAGTVEARLRFGAALARAGRDDEAVRALLPASAEPEVRRELLRWPSWAATTRARCPSGRACAGRRP